MSDFDIGAERLNGEPAAVIRGALARVLASDAFRAAPQLSAFLVFIVERAVAGRTAELKGYTIAVEAFGRSADFDPQSDPIVRVEAGRLRRALAQYYAGEGIADPVRMTIPVGAYVPAFEQLDSRAADTSGWRSMASEVPDDARDEAAQTRTPPLLAEPALERRLSRRWPIMAGLTLCIALLPLAAWYGGLFQRQTGAAVAITPTPPLSLAGPAVVAAPDLAPLEPTIVSISVPDYPDDPKMAAMARRFSSFLVDALARFDDLVVVKVTPTGATPPGGADYVFEINGQIVGETMESFGRLRAVRDGRIVWSASSTRLLRADDQDLPDIARRLATRLAEPFGIIHADLRQNAAAGPMRCIYEAIDMRRTMTAADHRAARQCVEDLIRRDPTFHSAWAQLAFLIEFEHRFGLNALPDSVERASAAALTAIRLAPASARAQQALMSVLFARGAVDQALQAGRLALARNPYDPDIMASLGSRYILLNRPAEGLPLVEKAIALSTGRPAFYDFYAVLGAYLLGAPQVSRGHALFLGVGANSFSLLGRAIRAVQTGDTEEMTEALRALCQRFPAFETDPRLWLTRRGFSPEVSNRLLSDFGIARP